MLKRITSKALLGCLIRSDEAVFNARLGTPSRDLAAYRYQCFVERELALFGNVSSKLNIEIRQFARPEIIIVIAQLDGVTAQIRLGQGYLAKLKLERSAEG